MSKHRPSTFGKVFRIGEEKPNSALYQPSRVVICHLKVARTGAGVPNQSNVLVTPVTTVFNVLVTPSATTMTTDLRKSV